MPYFKRVRGLFSALTAVGLLILNVPLQVARASAAPNQCFVEATGDNTTDYASADASALRAAVAAATAQSYYELKIAGTCAGVVGVAVVETARDLWFHGGYTNTNWTTADPVAHPTVLDAETAGPVIVAHNWLKIENLIVQNGVGNTGGGGARLDSGGVVLSSTFQNNTEQTSDGGAIFSAGPLTIVSSTIAGNTSNQRGGGVYFGGPAVITDTVFRDNGTLSDSGGGAFFADTATVMRAQFNQNYVTEIVSGTGGGGGAAFLSDFTVRQSLFMSNSILTPSASTGGGGMRVVATCTNCRIERTRFFSNDAGTSQGGGLYMRLSGGEVWMVNDLLAKNVAGTLAGGALILDGTAGTLHALHTTVYGDTNDVTVKDPGAVGAVSAYFTNTLVAPGETYLGTFNPEPDGTIKVAATYVASNACTPIMCQARVGGSYMDDIFPSYGWVMFVDVAGWNFGAGGSLASSGLDAGVKEDIDGRPRGTVPSPGAYEDGALPNCFVEYTGDDVADDSSVHGVAVQRAVNVAPDGGLIKVAGYCMGAPVVDVVTRVTLRGGYTVTNWLDSDPAANPTVFDARGYGTAIIGSLPVTIENLTVQNGAYGNGGGAVFLAPAVVLSSTFQNNVADMLYDTSGGTGPATGGAIYAQASVTIENSRFYSNAVTEGWGGAVHSVWPTTTLLVSNTVFERNAQSGAGSGGAIASNSPLRVISSRFVSNTAESAGGAIGAGRATTMTRSMFIDNTAANGQIYISGTARLENNIVAGAGSTAGIEVAGGSSAATLNALQNTIVGSGTAVRAGRTGRADAVVLTNTIIAGNAVGADAAGTANIALRGVLWQTVTTPLSGTATATGAVTGVAKFVDAAAGNYLALGAGVDAGVNSGVAEDYLGVARPRGAAYDLGAYEADPSVADAKLGGLAISAGALTPAFVSTTTSYTAAVANAVGSVNITPTVNISGATYAVASAPGTCTPTTSPANCTLLVGSNFITVVVTALNGASRQTYTVGLVRAASSDAALSGLAISAGTLSPAFVSTTTSYTAVVPGGTSALTVTATVNQVSATVTVSSSAGACTGTSCALAVGTTWVTTTVTAADGTTTRQYVVVVTQPSSDAALSGLAISAGTLSPAFVSTTTSYTAVVPGGTSALTVTATVNQVNATVTVSSSAGACTGSSCALAVGTTWVTTTVRAQDGTTTRQYVVVVTQPSNDATLSGLAITPGVLSPAFATGTLSYAATVTNGATSLALTPAVNDAGATYTLTVRNPDGTVIACVGATLASPVCPLGVGVNTITATVTAEDGTIVEYIVTVTRAAPGASNDASLGNLSLAPGALNPSFVSTTTSYTASVANGAMSVTVTAPAHDVSATVSLAVRNPDGTVSACVADVCPLGVGVNSVTVTVTAGDGTIVEYLVEVTRAPSSDATLSGLAIAPGTLSPAFSSGTLAYAATVTNGATSLAVTPATSDAGATYTLTVRNPDGTMTACAADACPLGVGVNTVTVTVTAADGTVVEYVVTVTRAVEGASSDASLGDLSIAPGVLNPAFVSTTTSYTASVANGAMSVTVTAPANDISATVTLAVRNPDGTVSACVADACPLGVGVNSVTVTVTAGDGTIVEYLVEVTRAPSSDATLSGLSITPGVLSPAFSSGTLAYAATVTNGATSLAVTPATSDAGATYSLTVRNPDGTVSVCATDACPLGVGVNTVTVTVTAADGTVVEYVVTVTRAVEGASSDASLSDLSMAPGELNPAFVSTTTSYTAAVASGATSVTVAAPPNDISATVTIASSAGSCDAGSCPVAGPTTWITVTVTAGDGTVVEYVVEVTVEAAPPSNDATLSGLAIAPWTLNPTFDAGTTRYAAAVANGTTSMEVAAANDAGATVTYASSTGTCTPVPARMAVGTTGSVAPAVACAVSAPTTWITVTVTAADGVTTQEYVIEVTVAAPLTAIGRVWPTLGLPEGGMPVTLFGTGFSMATGVRVSNSITNALVPFTVTGDGRIDFVMPAGVDGTWADITVETAGETATVAQAFWYQAPVRLEFNGMTGGVITLTNGVVITVPTQGISGTFVITLTPVAPESAVPGSVLLHVFQLEALLNSVPIAELTQPMTIALPVDASAVPTGQQPWLYQWTTAGSWVVVRGQQYDPAASEMKVVVRPTGLYALSAVRMQAYYLPMVPVTR